jgi:predicted glycoside hydrolase/deacetylase ChbG (UPF0249 family)
LSKEIRLVVEGDDFGMCHTVNEAVMKCFKDGIMTQTSLLVPPPWFTESVQLCKENPEMQVGVHLDLCAEWYPYRWRPVLPISEVPTLVDKDGYFFRTNQEFLKAKPNVNEVERELKAQVQLALDKGINVTYLDTHMGTANIMPLSKKVVKKISKEFRIPLSKDLVEKFNIQWMGSIESEIGDWTKQRDPKDRPKALLDIIRSLNEGIWMMIVHPGLDTSEMRSIDYSPVASQRQGNTDALTNPKVKEMIKQKNIQLVGFKDLLKNEEECNCH